MSWNPSSHSQPNPLLTAGWVILNLAIRSARSKAEETVWQHLSPLKPLNIFLYAGIWEVYCAMTHGVAHCRSFRDYAICLNLLTWGRIFYWFFYGEEDDRGFLRWQRVKHFRGEQTPPGS